MCWYYFIYGRITCEVRGPRFCGSRFTDGLGCKLNNGERDMSELEQLKTRIDESGKDGIETAQIRDDYDPVGAMMIRNICTGGEYVQRKVPPGMYDQKWKIFKKGMEPY